MTPFRFGILATIFAVACLSGCTHEDDRSADPGGILTPADQGTPGPTPGRQIVANCRAQFSCADRVRNLKLSDLELIAREVHAGFVEQIRLQPSMPSQLQAAWVGAQTIHAITKMNSHLEINNADLDGGGFLILVQLFMQSSVAGLSDQPLNFKKLDRKLAELPTNFQN